MLNITAPSEFSTFQDICILKPFIERLSREFKDVACEHCFKRDPYLKSCKACLDAKYCGKKCQKKDWKIHRLECQKLKNLPLDRKNVEADITRLIGNTILNIKGKDWKTIQCNILGMDISFDDIDARENSFPAYQHIFYNSKKENIRKYIGDENMPNDDDFQQILGKVGNSVYSPSIRELRVKTTRVLFELPFFLNECIPNCHIITRNGTTIIKAIKEIERSEKLSLSKIPLFGTFNIPGITYRCDCTDCRLPYGESVLSKITDEQRALDVIIMTQQFINTWELFRGELNMPDAEYLLDDLLEKHEGVLGDTNALHLKLLAIKCFDIEGDPLEVKRKLLKLEKNIVAAFGENHPHLCRVYSALAKTCFSLGNIAGGVFYLGQATIFLKMFELNQP